MIIKAYSNKDLARIYGVPYKSWLSWLQRMPEDKKQSLGKILKGLWTPEQVQIIVRHLGPPSKTLLDE